jgi:tetratricopeptide (TPR) repeat protein
MSNKRETIWEKETFLDAKRPFFWIAAIIFIIYLPTLFYGIVYLDDNVLVVGHYQFNSHLTNIFQAFGEDIFRSAQGGGSFYRPILRWTFIFDAQFGEESVIFMSHLTNMLLHILSMVLLFRLLIGFEFKRVKALLFVLLFAVHPLTSQTVAFISGRNDSLLAIFVFFAMILFLDFLKKGKNKYYIWHLIFFTLALFTKETAIVLPALCAVYVFILVGAKKIPLDWKKYAYFAVGWTSITVFWFSIRHTILGNFVGNADYDIFRSIYNNLPVILPAVGKIFLPFDLSVFPVMRDMSMIYGVIALMILTVWFFLAEKKNIRMILFGILWFFIFIVLTLIKPIDTVPDFSENRLYLPMFGFIFVIIGLGKLNFFRMFTEKAVEKMITAGAIILIVIFSGVTIYRNQYYKDKISFWENAVKTSPSFAFNHNNLGAMNFLDKNFDLAEAEFKKALEINPKEKMAHNNLGLVYANREKFAEAEAEYTKELLINPYYENAYFNLGLLYYQEKKYDEAKKQWEKTLEINPNHTDALYGLSAWYYDQKDYVNATKYAKELYQRGFMLQPELSNLVQSPKTNGILNKIGN